MRKRQSGFTLIEVVIALAILALVAVLGYRALASLTDSEVRLTAEAKHWRDLDAFFARLEADMRESLPREVRTGDGTEAAWVGNVDRNGNADLRFSRAGPEFAIEAGSAGQRIGYRMGDGAVQVLYWPRLDQPPSVSPRPYVLADGIVEFRVSYLDGRGAWRTKWPAPGEGAVPRAVKVAITLTDGGTIERWLALR
ncbi:MAG: type II secretion system minor pseudopilin GspJ [Betaproteobacteria bacterium]